MDSKFHRSLIAVCRKVTKNPYYSEDAARIHTTNIISCVAFLPGLNRKHLMNALLEKDPILTAEEIECLSHILFFRMTETKIHIKNFPNPAHLRN